MEDRPALTRRPLVVEVVDITSKPVRAGGISGPLHPRWTLRVVVRCDDTAIRNVSITDHHDTRRYARDWARERAHRLEWRHELPGPIEPGVAAGEVRSTGELLTLAAWPGTALRLLTVCQEDTRAINSRWRVREPLHAGLDRELAFLATGRRSGSLRATATR